MSRRYARTVNAYRATFDEPPPGIWFEPEWLGLPAHQKLVHNVTRLIRPLPPHQVIAPVENIPEQHRALWNKLKAFQFDKPGALYPYSMRLADESFDGDLEYAQAATDEYRKFLFLLGSTGKWVTPALDVDEAWHLHQDFTRLYWVEMMDGVMGMRLGHHPGNGSSEDDTKFQAIYQRTLHDYTQHFGEPPDRTWGRIDPNINWQEILAGTGF